MSYPQQEEDILMNQFEGLQVIDIYNRPPYPPGLMFKPTDEELIKYYLKPKVHGKQVPCNIIMDVELYKYHPKELAEKFKSFVEDAWYIFTSRNRKYANGSRPNRSAGLGYWKATGSDQEIVDKAKRPIGYKKSLVYHEGRQPSKDKTGWMMLEYRIDESCKPPNPADKTMLLDSWVLCKIFYKPVSHSGGSKDNGSVEKDISLQATIEENPTKQHEQNLTEQPDSQNSEPLIESQIDFTCLGDILFDYPEISHAMDLL